MPGDTSYAAGVLELNSNDLVCTPKMHLVMCEHMNMYILILEEMAQKAVNL